MVNQALFLLISGTRVFVVDRPYGIRVKLGYVLGWIACSTINRPGDIAYYAIDPVKDDMYRRYQYQEITNARIGGIFSKEIGKASVLDTRELLQAHVVTVKSYKDTILCE